MILIIYAHPYPRHSHANQRLLQAVKDIPGVEVRVLYELYPDFNIDIKAEQRALEQADMIVLQHPMQWYSLPPLLKLWIDKVLEHGWAYGHQGSALVGKDCLWAVTSGGDEQHFALGDYPNFAVLAQPLQATAIYCGMNWQTYFAVHGTFTCNEPALIAAGEAYRHRLMQYLMQHREQMAEQGSAHG